jgi:hypothetical protein
MAKDLEYRFDTAASAEDIGYAFRTAVERGTARGFGTEFRRPVPGDPFAAFEVEALCSTGPTSQNVPVLMSLKVFERGAVRSGVVLGRSRGGMLGLMERKLCKRLMEGITEAIEQVDPQLRVT